MVIFICSSIVILLLCAGYAMLLPITEESSAPHTLLPDMYTTVETYSVHSPEYISETKANTIFKDRVLQEIERQGVPPVTESINETTESGTVGQVTPVEILEVPTLGQGEESAVMPTTSEENPANI